MTYKDVFVSDLTMSRALDARRRAGVQDTIDYSIFLVGTGYTNPSAIITRWRDEQGHGEWFRVEVPDTAAYTADDPPIRVN